MTQLCQLCQWPCTSTHASPNMNVQMSCGCADVTNVEAELLKNTAGDPAQVAELQARVKELEMEQSLMQRELDNMSDVAQRTDNQLRYSPVLLCH